MFFFQWDSVWSRKTTGKTEKVMHLDDKEEKKIIIVIGEEKPIRWLYVRLLRSVFASIFASHSFSITSQRARERLHYKHLLERDRQKRRRIFFSLFCAFLLVIRWYRQTKLLIVLIGYIFSFAFLCFPKERMKERKSQVTVTYRRLEKKKWEVPI